MKSSKNLELEEKLHNSRIKTLSFQAIDYLVFLFLLLFVLASISASAESANFSCDDARICQRAEELRLERALFWTGDSLAGDWFAKCPIDWSEGKDKGGATSFTFNGGEVANFSMSVSGPIQEVLENILPHEVDHAVRATLNRRPVARIFDEGSAGLAESPRFKTFLRQQVRESADSEVVLRLLDAYEYPQSGKETGVLYSSGFSICEFLIERSGPEALIAFQQDSRRPSEKLHDHYELTPGGLIQEWQAWFNGAEFRVLIIVESESSCVPCMRLKEDVQRGKFRGYEFRFVKPSPGASIPRFTYRGKTKTGYIGPVDLNIWLKSVEATSIAPRPFSRPTSQQPELQSLEPESAQLRAMVENLRAIVAGLEAEKNGIRDSLSGVIRDVGEFREAGIIGKVKNLYDLRGEVSELKENASGFAEDVQIIRSAMNQADKSGEKVPWYHGLWLGFIGALKRRYLNVKALA